MPGNVDEAIWEKAKKQAVKQGQGKNYAYIMSIYQNMIKGKKMKKAVENIQAKIMSAVRNYDKAGDRGD